MRDTLQAILAGTHATMTGIDFFKSGLCFHCHLAKQELEEYQFFHAETEQSWKSRDSTLQDHISSILEKFPAADHDEIVGGHGWELHLNQVKCPDIHRTALVVAVYVFLEDHLNGLCEIVADTLDARVRLVDIRGQGTERAVTYLTKVAEFDFGAIPSLGFVQDVRRLRNKLVHAGAVLPDGEGDKLNRFVRRQVGLRGDPGHTVRIDSSFIDQLVSKFQAFFGELDGQVQHFMHRVSA